MPNYNGRAVFVGNLPDNVRVREARCRETWEGLVCRCSPAATQGSTRPATMGKPPSTRGTPLPSRHGLDRAAPACLCLPFLTHACIPLQQERELEDMFYKVGAGRRALRSMRRGEDPSPTPPRPHDDMHPCMHAAFPE